MLSRRSSFRVMLIPFAVSTHLFGKAPRALAGEATPTPRTMTVSVYFLRGGEIGAAHREIAIPADKRVATATVNELFAGPTNLETDAGLTTAIPENVAILDLTIDDETNTAAIDLSAAFLPDSATASEPAALPLAQLVFTLTGFPNVEQVTIAVDGQPLPLVDGDGLPLDRPATRADYERVTPLIFLESPAPGDTVASPVRLHGTANTFEAEFRAEILDADGAILAGELVVATSGNGTRGTFDIEITVETAEPGSATIVVYQISARDGSRADEVRVPVILTATSASVGLSSPDVGVFPTTPPATRGDAGPGEREPTIDRPGQRRRPQFIATEHVSVSPQVDA